MDAAVIKHYRRMLKEGFDYTGSIENPSVFLDTISEKIPICAQSGREYLNLYLNILNNCIVEIRYLCTCDPTANVVIEVLCSLAKGKTLPEARAITPEDFFRVIGSDSEELKKKVQGALALLNRGLERYLASGTDRPSNQ